MAVEQLSKKKLKHYEKILLKEKERTLKLLSVISDEMRKGSKDSSGDLSSYAIHQADLGTDTANMEKEAYLLEEEQKKLKLINQSLRRIYDKSYGICEITGEYISEKRLKAIPWANCSIEAQESEDLKKRKRRKA